MASGENSGSGLVQKDQKKGSERLHGDTVSTTATERKAAVGDRRYAIRTQSRPDALAT